MRGSEVLVKDQLSSSAKPTAQDDPTPEAVWNAKAPAPGPYWTSPLAPKISGRLAGILLMAGGLLSALTGGLPQPPVGNRSMLLLFAAVATVAGAIAFVLPWERWPQRITLVIPALGFAFVGIGTWLEGGQPYTLGVCFVLVFVWIGITQPRGTSFLFALPAALTYVVSVLAVATSPNAEASSVVFVIPVAVLLGESLALLTRRLHRSDEALKKERALMAVMQLTAVAANEATTVEDALGRCLDSVCWFMGWPIGHAFVVSDESPPRLRSASWRLADPKRFEGLRKATDAIEFRPGFDLPGMVAASGKPSWVIDVRKEPGFIRAGVAEELGVRGSFSFPVVIDAEVVAVLEFFSDLPEEPDEEALGVMAYVGEQLGQVLGRKRSEQTVAEAEARLAEAQRIAHLGSWVWDVTTNMVTCSQELIRLLGLEGEGLVRTYDEFLSGILPEEATWLRELMTTNAQDPRPLDLEVHGLGPPGELRDFYLQGRAVPSATGGPTKMFGTLQDITNRTRAERELEGALAAEREAQARLRAVDAMKSTLLHAVAHDLRSPLASILASVSVLQRDGTGSTELGRRLLDGLAYESRKMDRLLGDLLDLDRIEAGILEPNRRPTEILRLVRRVVADTKGLSARNVTVSVPDVIADLEESKVERILENLLRNLIAHTPPGTPAWITVGSDDAGVIMSVEDAGPGVPDEIKESIFMPFNQGARRAENTEGFGIGLSLVARFAELHGGKAWVEDRVGGGASFRVLLPSTLLSDRPGGESELLSPKMEAR